MRKIFIIMIGGMLAATGSKAQLTVKLKGFNRQDTLRGSPTPGRTWWDVTHYDIAVTPNYVDHTITGENKISAVATGDGHTLQLDLQSPMEIVSVLLNHKMLRPARDGNVYFLECGDIKKGQPMLLDVKFRGKPRQAVTPPWDGGWIWKRDASGAPWMTVACQGLGASVWYPCKDYQGDEPDSAVLRITVPDTLVGVGNGRLRSVVNNADHTATYTWAVVNPINNYNIVPYIGKYVHWSETFAGEKGPLDCNYWVLGENEEKAKKQFAQVSRMLTCFEHWFGPYPFYEDGYKLVESPHLGMEHQSAVAYGNKFENGYLGKDLSGTGWGLKWDFIIVHESAHEWFANSITTKDIADMWVHEGFASYSESLFTECGYGKAAGEEYCRGTRRDIANDRPVIGKYGVNQEGSEDMYYKGENLIQNIRAIIRDDEKFRGILRGLSATFYHQTVTTGQIEGYISEHAGTNLSKVFDQYLRTTRVPEFQYSYHNDTLNYRWANCVPGFDMPLRITAGQDTWLKPTEQWQQLPLGTAAFQIDPNFYVRSKKM